MPTSFLSLRSKLLVRVKTYDSAFDRRVASGQFDRLVDRFAFQEGLVSSLWQIWCIFCREMVIRSAQGAISANGVAVSSKFSVHNEKEIAFIAKKFSQRKNVLKVQAIAGSHMEPTWGDAIKLNLMISGIAPTNSKQMLTGFGAALALKDLQMCRNSNAHLNDEAIKNIELAKIRYDNTKYKHPSDIIMWTDRTNKDYLWKTWVDEMDILSHIVIQ